MLVAVYGRDATIGKGLGLAAALWLVMMAAYSPLIGWGVFGFGGAGHQLSPTDPLYLGSPVKYAVGTFVLHLIYGGLIGGLNPAWISIEAPDHSPA